MLGKTPAYSYQYDRLLGILNPAKPAPHCHTSNLMNYITNALSQNSCSAVVRTLHICFSLLFVLISFSIEIANAGVDPLIFNDSFEKRCEGTGVCKVFVTSGTYTGNLVSEAANLTLDCSDGLSCGDAICQRHAGLAGLEGEFVAWLSTDTISAVDRLGGDGGQSYARVDSTSIATNLTDLTDGSIANSINRIATNTNNAIPNEVWTGTGGDGANNFSGALFSNCGNWQSNDENSSGNYGFTTSSTVGWTAVFELSCDDPYRLYCFQR